MGNRLDGGWANNEVDQLDAGSGYAYDLKGALEYDPSAAADPRLHFQYGSDELLRQIDREGSSPLNQTSMTWDADEQRLQLTEQVSYDRWQFLYDAAAGIPAVLVQRTADQDNTTLGVTVYVREPGGELLASFAPGAGATYYHFDALGSTVLLSDSSGTPAEAYAYGAWGDVLAAPGGWQPYQYVGQLGYYTHTTSQGAEVADWLQLGVRFYQPELGRFERRDPVWWQTHDQTSYQYCAGMPLVSHDPTGETVWVCKRLINEKSFAKFCAFACATAFTSQIWHYWIVVDGRSVGFGPGRGIDGSDGNFIGQGECYPLKGTRNREKQEKCIKDNADGARKGYPLCGMTYKPEDFEYGAPWPIGSGDTPNNCMTFADCILNNKCGPWQWGPPFVPKQ